MKVLWPSLLCPVCYQHGNRRGRISPTPEVAHQVKKWRQECARLMWDEYDAAGRPEGHPPRLTKRAPTVVPKKEFPDAP